MASSSGIAALIEQHGTTRIAEAMGLPISTVHTWKRRDLIPGRAGSVLYEMRVRAFREAIATIAASKRGVTAGNKQPRRRAHGRQAV